MLAQMSAFTRSISRFCNGPQYEQRLRNHLSSLPSTLTISKIDQSKVPAVKSRDDQ